MDSIHYICVYRYNLSPPASLLLIKGPITQMTEEGTYGIDPYPRYISPNYIPAWLVEKRCMDPCSQLIASNNGVLYSSTPPSCSNFGGIGRGRVCRCPYSTTFLVQGLCVDWLACNAGVNRPSTTALKIS